MVGIGMPQGFESLFVLMSFAIPIGLFCWLLIFVVRGRREARGLTSGPGGATGSAALRRIGLQPRLTASACRPSTRRAKYCSG